MPFSYNCIQKYLLYYISFITFLTVYVRWSLRVVADMYQLISHVLSHFIILASFVVNGVFLHFLPLPDCWGEEGKVVDLPKTVGVCLGCWPPFGGRDILSP